MTLSELKKQQKKKRRIIDIDDIMSDNPIEKEKAETISSVLEETQRRRAERKRRLFESSQKYLADTMSGLPPLPKPDEVYDLSLEGLVPDDEKNMTCVGGSEETNTTTAGDINETWKKLAQMMNAQQTPQMISNPNPIINAAQQASTGYNPLGGSVYNQPTSFNPYIGGYGNYYGYYNSSYMEEMKKAHEEYLKMLKTYWRGTFMWGRPENVSVEDWTKSVDEAMKAMFPDPEEVKYNQEHRFLDYEYDDSYKRIEESGVSVILEEVEIDDDGSERVVSSKLMTPPNDPKTGKHTYTVYRSQDIAEYQEQLHFWDNTIRAEQELARGRYILDYVCAPPKEVMESTYASRMELGCDDPAARWRYQTYDEANYKRHMTRWRAGCYMSPKEYTMSFYMSGIDPNIRFDMNTMPTHFADRKDVKLAYDYQQHPELYNGQQVTQYLTNKLRVEFEQRKKLFIDKLMRGDTRVNYDNTVRDADPLPPIVNSKPIVPDENGVIMGIDGKPLYDPNRDLVEQLTPEEQGALTEYTVNARLAQYRQMGEDV